MKRAISIFMSLVFAALLTMNAYAKFTRYGDVTGDRDVNSSDALAVLMTSVGLKTLSEDEKKAADVDRNSKINSRDALYILSYSVGNIPEFPADAYSPPPDIGHDVF